MRWKDLTDNQRASGINLGWTGNDDQHFHTGGFMAGAEGAIVSGSVSGMVHVPFSSIWSTPAYAPPRFERTVDERREISTRITVYGGSEWDWMDNETKFWRGLDGDTPGWWHVFTRRFGELYLPMQLLDKVETPLDDDPSEDGAQEWDILLAADGEPRFRQPDLTDEWVYDPATTKTTTIKQDDERFSPLVTVGVGQLAVANRGTKKATWPRYTVTAPGRCWLADGMTGRLMRVPKLNKGEHVTIDTNPENRIAISTSDPVDDWMKQTVRNSGLLNVFLREFGEQGLSMLERFYGQGFDTPVEPGSVARLTVLHSQPGARVSITLPQRFESPVH